MKKTILILFIITLAGFGCKKSAPTEHSNTPAQPRVQTEEEKLAEQVSIQAKSQTPQGYGIIIDSVTSPKDGWIVVYQAISGQPGIPSGYSPIKEGENQHVTVYLTPAPVPGSTYYAIVHLDTGTPNEFDFPENDPPLPMKAVSVTIQ